MIDRLEIARLLRIGSPPVSLLKIKARGNPTQKRSHIIQADPLSMQERTASLRADTMPARFSLGNQAFPHRTCSNPA
jgi:hypothetical protein